MGLIPATATWFTVLDLKDASSVSAWHQLAHLCILMGRFSHGLGGQLTWTRFPQGFKNSPTIFGEALASDLKAYIPPNDNCALLQYIDDLLLAAPTQEDCYLGIQDLLHLLWKAGYRVSKKKAQICHERSNI